MFIQLRDEIADQLALDRIQPPPTTLPQANEEDYLAATNTIFRYRPIDLLNYLETFWSTTHSQDRNLVGPRPPDETVRRALGEPMRIGSGPEVKNSGDRPEMPKAEIWPDTLPSPTSPYSAVIQKFVPAVPDPDTFTPEPTWKHLIYAYAIENTRIVEVFRRVLSEMLTGERLGRPNATVLSWLRTTEEMFFTDRLGHWIFSPVSRLREDTGAIRRNAYYRMFGLDLNHGMDDGRPYPYLKPEVANRDFVRTFEQLLREIWRAYVNRRNDSGPNSTDNAAMVDLVLRLQDMLRDRRLYGNLAREEFYCVATLSWFHLTVSTDNQVVELLHAQGNNPAERLRTIGERVGLPSHSRSYNYILMADKLSYILSRIENWDLDNDNVEGLYDDVNIVDNKIPSRIMLPIINHWSAATGRNLKEFVGASGSYIQETPSFAMPRSVTSGGNGHHSLTKAN